MRVIEAKITERDKKNERRKRNTNLYEIRRHRNSFFSDRHCDRFQRRMRRRFFESVKTMFQYFFLLSLPGVRLIRWQRILYFI